MVTYQKWTQIAFEVARSKGADTSEEQTSIVSVAADVWNSRKADLSAATDAEARRIAREEISVA